MTERVFPDYLELIGEGHTIQPDKFTRRTDFERGPAQETPLKSRRGVQRQCRYNVCSPADLDRFDTWLDDTVRNGARFKWLDPYLVRLGKSEQRRYRLARIVDGSVSIIPATDTFKHYEVALTIEYWADRTI